MSFLNIFRKKEPQTNSSESSYASNFSDRVSGDYVKNKSRDVAVEDAESLWDCRDRMLLSLRKIKTEVSEDEAEIQPKDAPTIVDEVQPDTTIVDLQDGNVSSQTIDQSTGTSAVTYNPTAEKSQQTSSHSSIVVDVQPDTTIVDLQSGVSSQTIDQSTDMPAVKHKSATDNNQQMSTESIKKCVAKKKEIPRCTDTVITYKPEVEKNQQMSTECSIKRVPKKTNLPTCTDTVSTYKLTAGKSQQMSTKSSIKHVKKKTKLPPMIESQNTEWGESCMSMKEYSAYNSMVDKLCKLQTSADYPKHVKNRLLAPSYYSNSYQCCPCHEVMVPVHKIAYGVLMLVKQVLETRQLLERCLQQTDHRRPEIKFRLSAAAAGAKYLAGKLTFLVSDVNHTTGTPDQIEMLIDVYDACFRRFKKIIKIVRRIEMAQSEEMNDDNNKC
ncbi:uncharacterized protein LOC111036733 [Myzus persicae]|uniref:uncharacterized protein LOC111036733 n=1 Tax=Myzus persicae TaxID=13164 RepID=UPI000B936413|nr:uncharacterized protein LOC111036733 [Myzus persicae]